MKLDDSVLIPFDREAVLASEGKDHGELEKYIAKLIKQLRHMYFEIASAVSINDTPPIVTKTAAYTLTKDDKVILVDATGGAITITLPPAAFSKSLIYVIKKIDVSANAITVDGNASETIDGATTQALSSQWDGIRIGCNGTAWFILSSI